MCVDYAKIGNYSCVHAHTTHDGANTVEWVFWWWWWWWWKRQSCGKRVKNGTERKGIFSIENKITGKNVHSQIRDIE